MTESSEQLAMGEAFAVKAPEKKLLLDIATHIHVKEDGPKRSLIYRNSQSTWITCRDNENPCRCQIRRD
ncbi:hypothetical protein AB3S75_012941 [Citrus x aurantiifolia]